MLGLDRTHALQALGLTATALFLLSRYVPFPYRRVLGWVAIAVYLCLLTAVLVWVGLWLAGVTL